jgi:hypothetical protein
MPITLSPTMPALLLEAVLKNSTMSQNRFHPKDLAKGRHFHLRKVLINYEQALRAEPMMV